MASLLLAQLALVIVASLHLASGASTNEVRANTWIQKKNHEDSALIQTLRQNTWDYVKDPTEAKKNAKITAEVAYRTFEQEASALTNVYAWDQFGNRTLERLFYKYSQAAEGTEVLEEDQLTEYTELRLEIVEGFNAARHHDYCTSDDLHDCHVPTTATTTSRTTTPGQTTPASHHDAMQEEALKEWDFNKEHWLRWREDTKPLKDKYTERIALRQLIERDSDYEEFPVDVYAEMDRLMEQVKPLYEQLHAYVRMHLEHHYVHTDEGPHFPSSGQIPAHILGHDSGNIWVGIYDMMRPYPDEQQINFDARIKEIARTPEGLVRKADEFFESLGFSGQPRSFWEGSVLDKTFEDDDLGCLKVYMDMMNGRDYYIKQCTELDHRSWHHSHIALSYINYYRQYKNQYVQFRHPANKAFAAAVADAVTLSVMTPNYLKKKNIMQRSFPDNDDVSMNMLLATALKEVPLLPYAYMVEKWRRGVISGNITEDEYNADWWKLRCEVQGVWPPEARETDDFDAIAHPGIALDISYTRVFLATVLEFQVYKHLCGIAGHRGPLHKCDFSDKRNVGNHLKRVMQKGSSEPWQTFLAEITEEDRLDASALLEYFEPLQTWLEQTNQKHKETVGWDKDCSRVLSGVATVATPHYLALAVIAVIISLVTLR